MTRRAAHVVERAPPVLLSSRHVSAGALMQNRRKEEQLYLGHCLTDLAFLLSTTLPSPTVPPFSMSVPTSRVLVNASQNSPTLGSNHSPFHSHSDLAKAALTNSPSSRLRAAKAHEHGHSEVNPAGAEVGDDSRGSYKSWKRGEGLALWEREIVDSAEVRRKTNVAQLCECDKAMVVGHGRETHHDASSCRLSQLLL